MKRFGVCLATMLVVALGLAGPATAAPPPTYTADDAVKLDVLGEWAHPDDDVSIIGPCGVWHDRYGTRCGIIMLTRGEGGGNAVGEEIGPALGLRRENEDRVAHYRSGTVDIFNLDRVDFFYNTSAPLAEYFWEEDETLRRITRIIRMTQPEIYVGFTPSLAAGHGHHQQAGRYIWEGVKAAADPTMFPEQLTGPDALSTWQVKKIFSGFSGNFDQANNPTRGTGGTTTEPHCTTGYRPPTVDNVAGVWTGYESPYLWPPGNIQGQPAGTAKTWAQVAMEGTRAYPTQSRVMWQGLQQPGCSRFAMTDSFVPFQPNVNPDGSLNPAAGRDDAILFGATIRDPGGLPLGTLEYLNVSSFLNAPGASFDVTLRTKSGSGTLPAGSVRLNLPAGWTSDAAENTKPVGPITAADESAVTFTVTTPMSAAVNQNYRISAVLTTGGMTGYTDTAVRIVAPVEGRFQRWGKWEEYDNWLMQTAPRAQRIGYSTATQSMAVGETIAVPVVVRNRSTSVQTGEVRLTLPANVTADAVSKPYGPLAPGAETTVTFQVSNSFTNETKPGGPTGPQNLTVGITTTYSAPTPGEGSENLTLQIVPKTTIPAAGAAPTLDAAEGAGEYGGEALDVGRRWEGQQCNPVGIDCGSTGAPGDATSTYAKVTRHGDDLYFLVHVRDDFQSYASKPSECVAHWLADSVEIMIDPRGNTSSRTAPSTGSIMETGHTFKLGVFPFTNDPNNTNGNGVNGPCWSRDADFHQGYSTGPLASRVAQAPNAPGVQVASSATWVGTNETTTDHAYAGGGYTLEVKIPMAVLPAAVDPDNMAFNITPYDNDNTAATGTTTLRHIDQGQTRLAWSNFGSVQSNPYLWGKATLPGYTPPADRRTDAGHPILSSQNLNGTESPQTIWTSANTGVPIAGRVPAPANNRIAISNPALRASAAEFDVRATGPGVMRVFLWSGVEGYVPVWSTSCDPATNPPPDYGLTACSLTDGTVAPWGDDMGGRVVQRRDITITGAGMQRVSIPLTAEQRARLAQDGSALISFETPNDEVQAFDVPLAQARLVLTAKRAATGAGDDGKSPQATRLMAEVSGTQPFPGMPTGTVQFRVDGRDVGAPVQVDAEGRAVLTTTEVPDMRNRTLTAVYSGDGDYLPRSAQLNPKPGGSKPPPRKIVGHARLVRDTARLRGRKVTVRLRCPGVSDVACRGTVRLRTAKRVRGARRTLGTKAFRVPAGKTRSVTFRLSARHARMLKGRRIAARVYVTARDGEGRRRTTSARLTIRR